MSPFVLSDDCVINLHHVVKVDLDELDDSLTVKVHLQDASVVRIEGTHAIHFLMLTKPSVFEGRRFCWPRYAWVVHNLIGHPLMQILAFARKYDWAMYVHDATIPKPRGKK